MMGSSQKNPPSLTLPLAGGIEAGPSRRWRGVSQPKYFFCDATFAALLRDGSLHSPLRGRDGVGGVFVFPHLTDHNIILSLSKDDFGKAA